MVIQMDETIGVKGGANDRRRMMIINQNQKKKLTEHEEEREIAELEKKVRRKQFYTLIKTLPIVIGGGTIQTLYDTATGKKRDNKEEANSRWRIKEYDQDITHLTPEEFEQEEAEKKRKIITTPTGEKIVVYIEAPIDEKKTAKKPQTKAYVQDPVVEELKPEVGEKTTTNEQDTSQTQQEYQPISVGPVSYQPIHQPIPQSTPQPVTSSEETYEIETDVPTQTREPSNISVGIGSDQVDIETFIDQELSTVDFATLSPQAQETLGKLKSRKIVEEYEKRLKEIRYELRQVVYEYNALSDENDRAVLSRDAEIILDRLSEIIDKIEELKSRMKIDNLNQYDDNYVYTLIEGYLKEFHDKRIVSEIEDSPLYILLEEKLEELDEKRGKLSKKVDDKKDYFEEREIDFEELKKRYNTLSDFNNQLLEFQYDQNRLLKEIREKVDNAVTETERVREEFVGLNRQSRRLLRLMTMQMFLPGAMGARRAATAAAAYMYFMNNVINPQTRTRRYRVIVVKDYHEDIQNSIDAIDNAMSLLGKTTDQIDKMISELKGRFKDYIGVIPECDELLQNLHKIRKDMEEKEYEMQKIKEQQELELEKNDAKVKTRGEYIVN